MTKLIRCFVGRDLKLGLSLAGAVLIASCADRDEPTAPQRETAQPTSAITTTAAPLSFRHINPGESNHTCGVTTDDRAYCWGYNGYIDSDDPFAGGGQLGDGTTTHRTRPVAVVGGLSFRQISAGEDHSCGVTTDYKAYCWGVNHSGQLGDGTYNYRLEPVRVTGGLQFRFIDAGEWHTCALTRDNRAYCWGQNYYAQLGDGTRTDRITPTAVAGGLQFTQVSAGHSHSCAVTPTYQAYCWGSNRAGEIGDGSDVRTRRVPTLVAGGHSFKQVSAGSKQANSHTCAVTTGNRAFCWGDGRWGQIGDGNTYLRFTPRAVAGGISFKAVSAGQYHSCGVSITNRAFCWGDNSWGQLGDGTRTRRLKPVAVTGGLSFNQLKAGGINTCAKTPEYVGYCWGYNNAGALGDGTYTDRSRPTAVQGPM